MFERNPLEMDPPNKVVPVTCNSGYVGKGRQSQVVPVTCNSGDLGGGRAIPATCQSGGLEQSWKVVPVKRNSGNLEAKWGEMIEGNRKQMEVNNVVIRTAFEILQDDDSESEIEFEMIDDDEFPKIDVTPKIQKKSGLSIPMEQMVFLTQD